MPSDIVIENREFRYIVRIGEADLKGDKKILPSLRNIKGIGFSLANAICKVIDLDGARQVGTLSSEEINKIEEVVRNPSKFQIVPWLLNRRKDFETGQDKHVIGSGLKLQKDTDIKHLRKIKCYKGVRHSIGAPVRGQRTRSNFRHGKTVGVRKKGIKTATGAKK